MLQNQKNQMTLPRSMNQRSVEGEKGLLRMMLITALRDATRPAVKYTDERAKANAMRWFRGSTRCGFTFEDAITYLYGYDANIDKAREGVLDIVARSNGKKFNINLDLVGEDDGC